MLSAPALALLLAAESPSPAGAAGLPSRATTGPAASPVTARATASRAEVTVGEVFGVDVAVSGPPGAAYVFPGEVAEETVELRTPAVAPGAAASPPPPGVHHYDAAVFALGEARVPAITVRYRLPDGSEGDVATEPIALKVGSLLPKDPQQHALVDVREPVPLGIGSAFWIVVGSVAILIAVLVFAWLRRKRPAAAAAPPAPPVPPDLEAHAALAALAREGLLGRGEGRAFYIRLTGILKRYLERRLGAPVLEMTTAETLAFLREHAQAEALHSAVRDIAGAADAVKFAQGSALVSEAERHLSAARTAIEALEARLRPLEDAAQEASGDARARSAGSAA